MERIKGKMMDARMQREQMLHAHATPPEGRRHQEQRGSRYGMKRLLDLEEGNLWFLSGLVVLIATVIIGWRLVSQPGPGATLLRGSRIAENGQTDAVNRRAIEALEKQVTDLNNRVAVLTDSLNYLTSSIAREQTALDEPVQDIEKLPPPAAGQKAGNANLAQPPTPRAKSTAAVKSVAGTAEPGADHTSVAQKHPAGSVATGGPWVINLVSSPRKADADRFAEKARSRGIKTEQQLVTIKGQQYWRVQITGYATAEAARAYAGTARDRLGLRDVWITKR